MRLAVALLVVLAACSQPGVRRAELDDTLGGARIAPHYYDHTNEWRADGRLGDGDRVDWILVDFRTDVPFSVEVFVLSENTRTGFDSEIYGADGRLLARLAMTEGDASSSSRGSAVIVSKGPLYVRVAASATHASGDYIVFVTREPAVFPSTPASVCNRYRFDPSNPACKGRCDFKHPDPENPDCCELWLSCRDIPHTRSCRRARITWDGDEIAAPQGLANYIFGSPQAFLILDRPQPLSGDPVLDRKRYPIVLDAVRIDDHESRWRLHDRKLHDLDWLRAHATHLEVQIPLFCPA